MTPEFFVDALRTECCEGGVAGCAEQFRCPSGRRPAPRVVRLSQWFMSLSPGDRSFVEEAMHEAANATLFNVLCVIDGVHAIEATTQKSEFKLFAQRNGVATQLSPNKSFLHDLLRTEP